MVTTIWRKPASRSVATAAAWQELGAGLIDVDAAMRAPVPAD